MTWKDIVQDCHVPYNARGSLPRASLTYSLEMTFPYLGQGAFTVAGESIKLPSKQNSFPLAIQSNG